MSQVLVSLIAAPPPGTQPGVTSELGLLFVLAFGLIGLLIICAVQLLQNRKQRDIKINFMVLFGLLFVTTFGVAVAFADLQQDTRTTVYTLLGAVAGYLAGIKKQRQRNTGPQEQQGNTRPQEPGNNDDNAARRGLGAGDE